MQKVKVLIGEHPDELAALEIGYSLMAHPIENVSVTIANPEALRLGRRLVDCNMASAYPGDPHSAKYEERRAVEVLQECHGSDLLVSLHNFGQNGINAAIIDTKRGVSPSALGLIGRLGIRANVLTTYGGIQGYANNAFGLELDPHGLGSELERIRDSFDRLANDADPVREKVSKFRWLTFLQSAHIAQFDPAQFTEQDRSNLHRFEPLPNAIATSMGLVDTPAHLLTWRYNPNEQGYWGELVTPVAAPDISRWPEWASSSTATGESAV